MNKKLNLKYTQTHTSTTADTKKPTNQNFHRVLPNPGSYHAVICPN